MAEIEVRGRRAFYTTGGKAWEAGLPLLVFVHGGGATQSVWISQSRALAHHGWNVAAFDLPGHGASEDDSSIESIEGYAEWLAEALAVLGGEKAVVAGHSMGACIAFTLAAIQQERVAAVLLLGPRLKMEVAPVLLNATRDDPPQATRFIAAYAHAPGTHMGGGPTPGSWLLGAARSLINGCDGAVLHRDFVASDKWEGATYVERVSCPTLVVTGAQDRMTTSAQGKEMADVIADAKFVEVPKTGHFMMVEAPRPVLKIMTEFLAELE